MRAGRIVSRCSSFLRIEWLCVVETLAYFGYGEHEIFLGNFCCEIERNYYLICGSHYCIIFLICGLFFVVIKLYNKASGCSMPFGIKQPLFSFFAYLNETAPFDMEFFQTQI